MASFGQPPVPAGALPAVRPASRLITRRRAAVAAVLVLAISVALAVWVGSPDHPADAADGAAARFPTSGLPALGAATAVEVNDPTLNDVGDPFIVAVPSGVVGPPPGYVLYWTTDWSANIPAAVSTDLVNWRRVPDALPVLPTWARVDSPRHHWGPPIPDGVSTLTWGPTVQPVPGGWALYYSTQDAASGRQCVGAAFSSSPLGPFRDPSTAPLVCQSALGGDIDPSVVSMGGGGLGLLWKNDGNANGTAVGLWEQPLSADGRALTGHPTRLLVADQPWEDQIVEGPTMLADRHGGFWLFFTGGSWLSSTYDTGVAWCATAAGPCAQSGQGPMLSGVPTAVSPGGLATFVDHQGRLWAAYSAFPSPPRSARAAMAAPRVLELAPILSH